MFEKHAALTRSADLDGVAFVAWSETTLSCVLQREAAWWDRVRSLAREIGKPLVLGAFGVDRYPEGDTAPTNSAYMVTPGGHIAARWDKRALTTADAALAGTP